MIRWYSILAIIIGTIYFFCPTWIDKVHSFVDHSLGIHEDEHK
tara:strand:+ start:728 stop:856 length:129 start_codon:yes stop_codon:yes gene_type:complete